MAKKPRKPRLSITQKQRQSAAGAELLALCQLITEDGVISKEDILDLRKWLKDHRDSDLPAIGFLTKTVERIIADRRVTREERLELYKAIEKVLPPDERKAAVDSRQKVEARMKERDKAKREAEKQIKRQKGLRQIPVCRANFMVAGVRYEGRPEIIREYAHVNEQVYLVRDRQNQYSANAIEVRLCNGLQIGFVPEEDAVDMAPYFDQGCPHRAHISKILTGGRSPIPVVQAYLYSPGAGVDNAVYEQDVPHKAYVQTGASKVLTSFGARRRRQSGCLVLVLCVVTAMGILLAAIAVA